MRTSPGHGAGSIPSPVREGGKRGIPSPLPLSRTGEGYPALYWSYVARDVRRSPVPAP
jgi:hypothetical protein